MSKTPYRIKRAESPAEVEGAVRAVALAWQQSYQGLVPDEEIALRQREEVIARRMMEWAMASQEGAWFWIVMDSRDGRVVGAANAGPARDQDAPEILELVMLYLTDEVKGTGAASPLLQMAVGDMDCYLWVLEGNERAIAFYAKEGFVADGEKRTGDVGSTEIRMVRRAE